MDALEALERAQRLITATGAEPNSIIDDLVQQGRSALACEYIENHFVIAKLPEGCPGI